MKKKKTDKPFEFEMLEHFEGFLAEILDDFSHKSRKVVNQSKKSLTEIQKLVRDTSRFQQAQTNVLEEICNHFGKICSVHAQVEETMMNVLLAIRQNEYLQAWYPAQKGFPEQRIVGVHPISVEEKYHRPEVKQHGQ